MLDKVDIFGPLWYEKVTIYDVGMNTGQDTEYFLKKGFNVVGVEANPLLCVQVSERFSHEITTGKLKILNIGIGRGEGLLPFFINNRKNEWSSFVREIAGRDGGDLEELLVPTDTMANIIRRNGFPYYVKIDIEGHDEIALNSIIEAGLRPPYVSVENGGPMINSLKMANYNRFQYVQQNNVHNLSHVTPPLEGCFVDHTFEPGASGKFGEELEGPWLTYDECREKINKVWDVETGEKNLNWNDEKDGWFDLHARHCFWREIMGQRFRGGEGQSGSENNIL